LINWLLCKIIGHKWEPIMTEDNEGVEIIVFCRRCLTKKIIKEPKFRAK
jgi:hypothetical protein